MASKNSRVFKYGNQPIRKTTVDVVRELGGAATVSEVDNYLKAKFSNYKDDTYLNLIANSVNCKRSYWSFNKTARRSDDQTHRHHEYDKLYKRGERYEIYQPSIHGIWELYEDIYGKWCFREIETIDEAKRLQAEFEIEVRKASQLTSKERKQHLAVSNFPEMKEVITKIFVRNPYVVAEVLHRAQGKCELCKRNAPFLRGKDGTPYLEVHHCVPLSQGGEDTVENAIAVCPNCHRQAHFG
ncbi:MULTISPECIES: HNH endonuclease [Pectobacterium]|uniref:HNH endonuclease n=1 Tax=Pectobacterium TaxID=122277 RepID=UPI00101DF81F|nr:MULTISPECIES: HNH endonuclease signature motif containing protein [Pectobacterium]MBN3189510.1 HNH endonuclease [Pectobacterium brasiliense]RYC43083.1 HNH endonuclease [Pectobacterium zantedeschiae]